MQKPDEIHALLLRQQEYYKYLYEQEQKRAASIVGGAKVYIAFLVFILGSILYEGGEPRERFRLSPT